MEAATIALTKLLPLRSIFDALPNPILVVDENNIICFANSAAEDFFQASSTMLARHKLEDCMPFSSPVLEVVNQVRQSAGVMNEYSVGVGTPRMGGERIVDLQTALVNDDPRFVVLTLLRRSMAQKFDLQLTHRGAARSVSGMAAMLAHEIKNPCPASGGLRNCWNLFLKIMTVPWQNLSVRKLTVSGIWWIRWRFSPMKGPWTASPSTFTWSLTV